MNPRCAVDERPVPRSPCRSGASRQPPSPGPWSAIVFESRVGPETRGPGGCDVTELPEGSPTAALLDGRDVLGAGVGEGGRSAERREGKAGVSTGRARGTSYRSKKQKEL